MRILKTVCKLMAFVSLAAMSATAFAQGSSINTFSPYSFFGVGDMFNAVPASLKGMGGAGLGYRSPYEINFMNPAAYSSIERRSALFHVGMEDQNFYLKSSTTKTSYNTFNVSDVALQLPIAKGVGFALSVSPYSSVGYSVSRDELGEDVWEDIGYVHYSYSGSGGVNQIKAGVGWSPVDWLSIGAEAVYYQGNIIRNYSQTIIPLTGTGYYVGVNSDNHEYISRLMANFGVQARLFARENASLTLGVIYNMGGRLRSRISETIMHGPYYTTVGTDEIVNREYRSSFILPDIYGGGLYYNSPRFSAGLDYRFSSWGANNGLSNVDLRYRNTHSLAAGVQFVPNPGDVRKVMKRWSYRIGARYDQYYMILNGHAIDQAAITLGVGIPWGQRGRNKIDIGIELGTRGTVAAGLIKENYFKVSVGLSLFGDDYWFMKYKYD